MRRGLVRFAVRPSCRHRRSRRSPRSGSRCRRGGLQAGGRKDGDRDRRQQAGKAGRHALLHRKIHKFTPAADICRSAKYRSCPPRINTALRSRPALRQLSTSGLDGALPGTAERLPSSDATGERKRTLLVRKTASAVKSSAGSRLRSCGAMPAAAATSSTIAAHDARRSMPAESGGVDRSCRAARRHWRSSCRRPCRTH